MIKDTFEYGAIQRFYGDRRAERSGILLMHHIEEGIKILEHIGADTDTIQAYVIHPLFQNDYDLRDSVRKGIIIPLDTKVLTYILEYRYTANAYLSQRTINSIDEIKLSILPEVNQMLIADKVQNYKDFLKYHKDTHARSTELDQYFKNWFKKLNISNEEFENYLKLLG